MDESEGKRIFYKGGYQVLDEDGRFKHWEVHPQDTADAEFVAQAREGWPHAIERALKAEAEVEKLRVEVEELKLRGEVLYDFATKYLCLWETKCLKPFHDASDCVGCREKFLEREETREREKDGGRESA